MTGKTADPCYTYPNGKNSGYFFVYGKTFYTNINFNTVKEKGGKPDRKPYPLPYGLIKPYRNLMSENSQDYALKPQKNCTSINSASGVQYMYMNNLNMSCTSRIFTVSVSPPRSCPCLEVKSRPSRELSNP
jgi:hypothetical protein